MIETSIIIPMYNESEYIHRCLDSLNNQSYKNFEVILIDDGSKDDSIKIARQTKTKYPIRILNQNHGGPGKARNWGAQEAEGNILVFVDADMYFDKEFIKNLIYPILKGEEIGTSHGTELIGNMENIWAKTRGINRITKKEKRCTVYRAFKKDAFFKSGGYNNDRFAFEDHIGNKNKILALVVDDAICYHNNPTNLKEVFYHEIWMGESLIAKGKISTLNILSTIIIILLIIGIICYFMHVKILYLILFMIIIMLLILECIGIKKIHINKKYIKDYKLHDKGPNLINYVWSFPILSIVRIFGCIYGIFKYIICKK